MSFFDEFTPKSVASIATWCRRQSITSALTIVSERGNYDVPSGTTIPKGNYTIGEEIPAGTYKIYFGGSTTSRVRVFQDADEASNTFNKGKETILDWNNTEGTVTLSDGNILRVEYTPIIMTKGGGFTFDWSISDNKIECWLNNKIDKRIECGKI